jgi:hypothetical protein
MTFIRSAAFLLLAGVGFALAVPAAAPARQKDEGLPRRPSGLSEMSTYRQAGVPPGEIEKAKKTFAAFAEYHAALIASPTVYRATLDFRPDPLIPTLDSIIGEVNRQVLIPTPNPTLGQKVGPENADYIRELGAALDAALKGVIESNPERIVKVNATRMLAAAAQSGAVAHYPTVTGLLTRKDIPLEVKYHTLKAAENLLAAYDLNDYQSRKHSAKPKEVGDLVRAVEDVIVNPAVLSAGAPAAAGQPPPAPDPNDLAVNAFIRRQAVRALAQVRFASLPGPDGGEPLYPSHTLARVILGDPALVPPPTPAEIGEAVIGLANMAPTKGYAADAAADVVATGVIKFAAPRAADPADRSIPWRTYAVRMAEALRGWKPLFDPLYDPARPAAYNQAAVPKPVAEVADEAVRLVLAPMDTASPAAARINIEGLTAVRQRIRDNPKRSTTLYTGVPKTSIVIGGGAP